MVSCLWWKGEILWGVGGTGICILKLLSTYRAVLCIFTFDFPILFYISSRFWTAPLTSHSHVCVSVWRRGLSGTFRSRGHPDSSSLPTGTYDGWGARRNVPPTVGFYNPFPFTPFTSGVYKNLHTIGNHEQLRDLLERSTRPPKVLKIRHSLYLAYIRVDVILYFYRH